MHSTERLTSTNVVTSTYVLSSRHVTSLAKVLYFVPIKNEDSSYKHGALKSIAIVNSEKNSRDIPTDTEFPLGHSKYL